MPQIPHQIPQIPQQAPQISQIPLQNVQQPPSTMNSYWQPNVSQPNVVSQPTEVLQPPQNGKFYIYN